MTEHEFVYWLHGFAELNQDAAPTPSQWLIIKDHLSAVFVKVTPARVPTTLSPSTGYVFEPESLADRKLC